MQDPNQPPRRAASARRRHLSRRKCSLFVLTSSRSPECRTCAMGQAAYKPGSVPAAEAASDGHSSGTSVTGRFARPTRTTGPETGFPAAAGASSLLGLAPGGVYRAVPVAEAAVRPYRTLSPSPAGLALAGRLLSVALSLGSPPPGITRHRVSVEPGLSSPGSPRERPSGHLAQARCRPGNRRFQALTAARAGHPGGRASPGRGARRRGRDESGAGTPRPPGTSPHPAGRLAPTS